MHPVFLLLLLVWLFASILLASVALASKMSFLAWLFVGLVAPVLALFMAGEYMLLNLSHRGKTELLPR